MALSFPLSLAAFADTLRVAAMDIGLGSAVEQSRTGAGEVFTADLGARLWRGRMTLVPAATATQAAVQAILNRLTDVGATFRLTDISHQYPTLDPDGSILGAASVTINALPAGGRELRLIGLPTGYTLSRGDYLAFTYGSSPVRYAFHQIVTGATSTGPGVQTSLIEVMPPIRAGATVATTVSLRQPAMKALIGPGSLSSRTARAVLSDGLTFDFMQTLR